MIYSTQGLNVPRIPVFTLKLRLQQESCRDWRGKGL